MAQPVQRLLYRALAVGGEGHIAAHKDGLSALIQYFLDDRAAAGLIQVRNGDGGPFAGEKQSGGPPDARGSACNQGSFVC
jgi:hypothetical protein